MKIGILSDSYPNKRNINNKTNNVYKKINHLNINAYLRTLVRKFGKDIEKTVSDYLLLDGYRGSFIDAQIYDIAHLFNSVSFSGRPWISTFETTVPFFRQEIEEYLGAGMEISAVQNKWKLLKGIEACSSDSCKALIALSKCAMNIQLGLISNYPNYEASIKSKLINLYPPQELLIESLDQKPAAIDNKLKFMFVGREFYRKGGLEILRCFEELAGTYQFELIIISSLQNDIPKIIPRELELEAQQLIEKHNGSWLSYHEELENSAVLDLMKSAHIGLLPTYSETFGFSVLEFQACGCPVISTDVRALPEINNNEIGWIISTGKKTPHREIESIQDTIRDRLIGNTLKSIVINIFKNRHEINNKAEGALQQISNQHSPVKFRESLASIYRTSTSIC
jgi:glycosyltransferase involved in cell wall biosynthesis